MDSASLSSSTDLIRRWQEQLAILRGQLTSAPAITVESTRGRLRKLYEQAQLSGALLPQPAFTDEAFTGMSFRSDLAVEAVRFATEEAEREKQREKWREAKAVERKRLRELAGRRKYAPRQYKTGILNDCLCGCGTKVRAHFAAGHITLWTNWMRRIERGEMPRESLNKTLQERLRWCRCMMCGGFMPTTDAWGKPMAKRLGYDCQRRARILENAENVDPRLRAVLSGDEKEAKRWSGKANQAAYDAKHLTGRKGKQ
jgi:hypothetical protein